MSAGAAADRVAAIVGEVVRQIVRDAGARGIALLDDGSPEAVLCYDWCARVLDHGSVHRVPLPETAVIGACVDRLGSGGSMERVAPDVHRLAARIVAEREDALIAHPANKTVLLLSRSVHPEPLLPLGDVYASRIRDIAGGWSGPAELRELASLAGGIARLDAALERFVEERHPLAEVATDLGEAGEALKRAWEGARFARRRIGFVPKLSSRTLGIDLFG